MLVGELSVCFDGKGEIIEFSIFASAVPVRFSFSTASAPARLSSLGVSSVMR